MNFKAMALLLIMMFAGGLAVSQEMGLISITAWTTSTTYEGDVVSITYADSTNIACGAPGQTVAYYIDYVVISQADTSKQWEMRKYKSGVIGQYYMISHATSWVAQEPGLYEVRGVAVCSIKDAYGFYPRLTPISSYMFTINEKPADITCTNDCTILGSRDIPYGQCPYRKCGYYDVDECLEWSAPITDSTCIIDDPVDPVDPTVCPTDVYQCPDGSYVNRNIDDSCNFFLCPVQMCESIWKTGAWSECRADGFQVRQVFDYNQCAEPTGVMPDNKQTCTPPIDIVDPVCGTYQKISESDCIEGKKLVQYENSCGEETENFETCVSEEFFDQKTIIMIALVMAAVIVIAVLFSRKK